MTASRPPAALPPRATGRARATAGPRSPAAPAHVWRSAGRVLLLGGRSQVVLGAWDVRSLTATWRRASRAPGRAIGSRAGPRRRPRGRRQRNQRKRRRRRRPTRLACQRVESREHAGSRPEQGRDRDVAVGGRRRVSRRPIRAAGRQGPRSTVSPRTNRGRRGRRRSPAAPGRRPRRASPRGDAGGETTERGRPCAGRGPAAAGRGWGCGGTRLGGGSDWRMASQPA